MKGKYDSRKENRILKREGRIRNVVIRLFIMILIITWGGFSIGAKTEDQKPDKKLYGSYTKSIVNSNLNSIDKKSWEKDRKYVKTDTIDDWQILLVNTNNPIPEGYSPELSNIDSTRKFDSRAIGDLINLIEDCKHETGFSLWAQSTYRDRNTQKALYNVKVQKYIAEGESMKEAKRLASCIVAVPGTSEHETGLAVDFNNVDLKFENNPAFKWLVENSHEYGFILRYPKDKQSITNIEYEPWHFRYVGKDHAKIIKLNSFCLEEYIIYLKE